MPIQKKTILKIIILGDSGVGKTCLMNRYHSGKYYTGQYKATIGADFVSKEISLCGDTINSNGSSEAFTNSRQISCNQPTIVNLPNSSKNSGQTSDAVVTRDSYSGDNKQQQNKKVILQIWDTAGQERFQSLGVAFYRGADACILVYDVQNPESLENLINWQQEFLNHVDNTDGEFPFILLGNKVDLRESNINPLEHRARDLCRTKFSNCSSLDVSAAQDLHVNRAFEHISKLAVERKQRRSKSYYDFEKSSTPVHLQNQYNRQRSSFDDDICC